MRCPSVTQLLSFAQKELLSREAEGIGAHLDAGCERCHRRLSQLQKVLSVTAIRSLKEPPEWLVHQALAHFGQIKSQPRESLRSGTLALLVVDSFAEERLLGFRGTGLMSRQMLYRAGEYDIDLSIDYDESSQSVAIIGQSMPLRKDLATVAGAHVELLRGSHVACATKMNEFGEFILDGIPEEIYDLRIALKDEEIKIAGLQAIVRPQGKQTGSSERMGGQAS